MQPAIVLADRRFAENLDAGGAQFGQCRSEVVDEELGDRTRAEVKVVLVVAVEHLELRGVGHCRPGETAARPNQRDPEHVPKEADALVESVSTGSDPYDTANLYWHRLTLLDAACDPYGAKRHDESRKEGVMRALMSSQKVNTYLHDMRLHAHAKSRHPRARRRG
jgi:hypothetical protein